MLPALENLADQAPPTRDCVMCSDLSKGVRSADELHRVFIDPHNRRRLINACVYLTQRAPDGHLLSNVMRAFVVWCMSSMDIQEAYKIYRAAVPPPLPWLSKDRPMSQVDVDYHKMIEHTLGLFMVSLGYHDVAELPLFRLYPDEEGEDPVPASPPRKRVDYQDRRQRQAKALRTINAAPADEVVPLREQPSPPKLKRCESVAFSSIDQVRHFNPALPIDPPPPKVDSLEQIRQFQPAVAAVLDKIDHHQSSLADPPVSPIYYAAQSFTELDLGSDKPAPTTKVLDLSGDDVDDGHEEESDDADSDQTECSVDVAPGSTPSSRELARRQRSLEKSAQLAVLLSSGMSDPHKARPSLTYAHYEEQDDLNKRLMCSTLGCKKYLVVSAQSCRKHLATMLVPDFFRTAHWQCYWCPKHREALHREDVPHLCMNCGLDDRNTEEPVISEHRFETRADTALPIKLCAYCSQKPHVKRQLAVTKNYQPRQPKAVGGGPVRGNYLTARQKQELEAVAALKTSLGATNTN